MKAIERTPNFRYPRLFLHTQERVYTKHNNQYEIFITSSPLSKWLFLTLGVGKYNLPRKIEFCLIAYSYRL